MPPSLSACPPVPARQALSQWGEPLLALRRLIARVLDLPSGSGTGGVAGGASGASGGGGDSDGGLVAPGVCEELDGLRDTYHARATGGRAGTTLCRAPHAQACVEALPQAWMPLRVRPLHHTRT
jgi:hypothetical protein